jgi:hypothetical protein
MLRDIGRMKGQNPNAPVGEECLVVSASKIHMLGLDAIKARLGPKWNRMSDLVHRYFEAAIRRELAPGDTFCSSGELSYLVLFRDLSVAEISIRSLVAPMDIVDLADREGQARLNASLERDGRETLFSSKSGMAQSIGEILHVEMVSLRPPLHTVPVRNPAFVYRPLWDTSRSAVLTYICQLLPDAMRGDAAFSGPFSADNEEGQLVLDQLCLRECLQRVQDLRQSGLRVILAVPVHFSTLCRLRHWGRYRAFYETFPSEIFRDIAFLVYGFDSGVPHIRLSQELPKLSRMTSYIYCIVDGAEAAGQRFANTGVHAVGLALQPGSLEKPWIERAKALARESQGSGLEVFVLGAAARSAAVNAIGAGARYLEGPFVRAAVVNPRNAYAQKVEDTFLPVRFDAGRCRAMV